MFYRNIISTNCDFICYVFFFHLNIKQCSSFINKPMIFNRFMFYQGCIKFKYYSAKGLVILVIIMLLFYQWSSDSSYYYVIVLPKV